MNVVDRISAVSRAESAEKSQTGAPEQKSDIAESELVKHLKGLFNAVEYNMHLKIKN
ncbi:MAG: hypothetical protein NTV87_16660 [Ignavibacteriae bacterium]|nr:hypothetical protein [Ignavibacteriota bacterium]